MTAPGQDFPAGAFQQVSLMKWVEVLEPNGSEKRASAPSFPEIAIHGNFSLWFLTIS
jgi:hypothetical protein